MALTPVPTIDPALPVPPNPADEEAVFDAKAYAWSNGLPGFGDDVKAIGDATYANAQWAETKAGEAATQAGLATTNGAAQVALAAAQVSIAAGHASNASTSANNAAESATAAAASATEAAGMVEKYQGALAADPVLDKSGGPLTDGDWYVSTVTGFIRAYTVAGGWVNGLSAVAGVSSVNGEAGAITGVLKASGGTLTGAINEAPAMALASATTTDIGAQNSNNLIITGTATITSLGDGAAGVIRRLVFSGALTLTQNSTSLILPGGANIATAAGDVAEFLSLGSGNWRCTLYQKASGAPVVSPPTIANLVRSARSTNTALGVADKGIFVDITGGTFTQTLAAASILGSGWWCYIRNSGSGVVTLDPDNVETIDGALSKNIDPQQTVLLQCDGSVFRTVAISGIGNHYVTVHSGNGYGSTNTAIRKFTTTQGSAGTAITYATSATLGASFTVNEPGLYSILYIDGRSSSGTGIGISLNSTQLSTDVIDITAVDRLASIVTTPSAYSSVSLVTRLSVGDVIRPHTNPGAADNVQPFNSLFSIRKVGL